MATVAVEPEQEQKVEWPYQSESTALVPMVPGQHDDLLIQAYLRAKAEGLLSRIFPEGGGRITAGGFMAEMSGKPMVLGFSKATGELIGLGWLWDVRWTAETNRKASCAFYYFRKWWGKPEIKELSRFAIRWWFYNLGVTVLFGPQQKVNILARRFAESLGFKKVADIPSFFCNNEGGFDDATVMMLVRGEER
jgi:RimJ/RimL family protein N-acetyltransferase